VCAGRCEGSVVRGDVGEALLGVTVAEFTGEICWVCELKSVYCEGDAVDCCTGIANSGAMALMGLFGVSTLSSSMEEVGGGWAGSASRETFRSKVGFDGEGPSAWGGVAIMPEQCDNRLSAVSS
jgi:hypothetical protein